MPPRRPSGTRNVGIAAQQAVTRAAMQQAHVVTRDGFPWAPDTRLFHATAAMDRIRREGFRTRKTGASQALGGSHTNSVSFTLSERRAAAIALGLDVLIRGAKGELSLVKLLKSLVRECPNATREGLQSGYNQSAAMTNPRDPMSILPTFELLDEGWRWFYAYSAVETPPARGAKPVSRGRWLLPPWADDPPPGDTKASVPTGGVSTAAEVFFETYQAVVRAGGGSARECFNPIWIGTNMRALAELSTEGVGIVVARSNVPRVCSDARGLIRLGYFDPSDFRLPGLRWGERSYHEALDGWGRACQSRLAHGLEKADAQYDNQILRTRVRDLLANAGWSGSDQDIAPGGWVARQQGRVRGEDTMLYHNGEEEIRVYAPRAIEVLDVLDMQQVRWRNGLLGTGRVTFPWFDSDEEDVRVWPPQASPRWSGR